MNFARLNHILIPSTKDERDRLWENRAARLLLRPLARTWLSLTDEGRGLLGLSMVASLVGLDVVHGQNHLLWALAFSLMVASIAARPLLRLSDVRVDVEGPRRVGVGAEARFRIHLTNDGGRAYRGLRIGRPFLPWDGSWLPGSRRVAELLPGGRASLEATARFVERGHHHIDSFSVGALVPLGLATGPTLESRGTRFVVVPRIAPVDRITLPDRARHQQGGVALASHTGESMELAGLRAWRDGDRIRDLHARSWARLGEPVVREYQQEYFSRIAVVLDTDDVEVDEPGFEATVSLAAGILRALMRGEALIDLQTAGSEDPPLTLGRSLGGFDQALDRLAGVVPGAAFDAEAAFAAFAERLDRISALVFVTTTWDPAREAFIERLRGAGVGVNVVRVAGGESSDAAREGVRVVSVSAIEDALAHGRGLLL